MPMTITESISLLEIENLKNRLFFRMECLYEEIQEMTAKGEDTSAHEAVWKSLLTQYDGDTLTFQIEMGEYAR